MDVAAHVDGPVNIILDVPKPVSHTPSPQHSPAPKKASGAKQRTKQPAAAPAPAATETAQ